MITEKIEKESNDIVYVYTTCSDMAEARSIGLSVINERLAISADYWLINSIYPWKGVVQEVDQCMLMITTQKKLSDELIKHIEVRHSYEIPVITMCDISMTNQIYNFWAENTLNSKEEYITEAEAMSKNKDEGYQNSRLK